VSPDQFFAWVAAHEGRYELVDGEIVMLAPAARRHDRVVVNLLTAIHGQLRGGPCQTFTAQTFVATLPATRRMPDLGVDCGRKEDQSLMAQQPSLLVEVLSPATSGFDVTVKLSEYQSMSCLDHILFVDTENPRVHLYSRGEGVWKSRLVKGLDAVIQLEKLNVTLGLRDIYDGLELRPRRPTGGLP
jgi:Uma2 family endonuclease